MTAADYAPFIRLAAAARLSMSETARMTRRLSRNAVAGWAWRNGVTFRGPHGPCRRQRPERRKLTEAQVQEIKASPFKVASLAVQYGVAESTIWRARRLA